MGLLESALVHAAAILCGPHTTLPALRHTAQYVVGNIVLSFWGRVIVAMMR